VRFRAHLSKFTTLWPRGSREISNNGDRGANNHGHSVEGVCASKVKLVTILHEALVMGPPFVYTGTVLDVWVKNLSYMIFGSGMMHPYVQAKSDYHGGSEHYTSHA